MEQLRDKILKDANHIAKLRLEIKPIRGVINKITNDIDNSVITPKEGQDLFEEQEKKEKIF